MNALPLQLQLFRHWDLNMPPLFFKVAPNLQWNLTHSFVSCSLGLGTLLEFEPLHTYLIWDRLLMILCISIFPIHDVNKSSYLHPWVVMMIK